MRSSKLFLPNEDMASNVMYVHVFDADSAGQKKRNGLN